MASGVAAFGLFKKPPWPRQKMLLYGFGTAFMSHDLGEVGVWNLRRKWIQSLENQRGFELAMNNIEARLKNEQMDTLLKRPNARYPLPSNVPSPAPPSNQEHLPEEPSSQWSWQSERDENGHAHDSNGRHI